MTPEVKLILIVAIIMVVSPFLARMLRIPTTPIEIVLGALAGYYSLISHEVALFKSVAEFGFLYLMFLAGSEVNFRKLFRADVGIIQKSFLYIAILYVLSFIFAKSLDLSNIFILIFPLISIGLVASLAKEFGKDMTWIKLSFIVGSIGEVVSIGLLTVSGAVIKFGFNYKLTENILFLILFLFIVLASFRFLGKLFLRYRRITKILMPRIDNKEQDLRLSFGLMFFFLVIAHLLNLELAFGAFVAGIFLPSFFKHKHELPEKLSSFGFGLFIPIFFIYIGSSFRLEALLMEGLITMSLVISLVMIMMRLLASFVFYPKLKVKGTLLFGFSHSMPLTLLLAVATLAYGAKSIDEFHYFAFILASLFQVIVSMVAINIITHAPKFIQKYKAQPTTEA